eukprot:728822-Rhodomonas_salina.1
MVFAPALPTASCKSSPSFTCKAQRCALSWRLKPLVRVRMGGLRSERVERTVSTGERAVSTGERAVSTGERAVSTGERAVRTGERAVSTEKLGARAPLVPGSRVECA